MKNIFIIWITIQLILIGIVGVLIENEIAEGKYDCNRKSGTISPAWGAVLPLVYFTNDVSSDYCNNKKNNENLYPTK